MTAKQKPNQTSKITQLYLDYCKEIEAKPEHDEDDDCVYILDYQTRNGNIQCFTRFFEEYEEMVVKNYTPINLVESRVLSLYKLANAINNTLDNHSLVLFPEDNLVMVRNSAPYSRLLLEANLKNVVIESGVSILDHFIPAFHLVSYGTMDVDKALETVDRLEHTQEMVMELPN